MRKFTNYKRLYWLLTNMKEGQTLALIRSENIIEIKITKISDTKVEGLEPDRIFLDEATKA